MVNYTLALLTVLPVADMNPVAAAVRFPDQLVEMEVVHHPDEPLFAGLFIRNVNVGRFARQVLRVLAATHSLVQFRTTVTRVDEDGAAGIGSQWFQYFLAESLQSTDNLLIRSIVYV